MSLSSRPLVQLLAGDRVVIASWPSLGPCTVIQFVQEAGANQCTPGTQPAPVGEFVRFEGTRAHLSSNDGTLQFDKYADAAGATTLSWKMAAETVTLAVTKAGMTVTRNGLKLTVGTTATDAQMKAIGTLLNNSTAITRFRLNAMTKLARAKARAATVILSATARAAEDGYIGSGGFVSSLAGDAGAINSEGPDHSGGQVDCTTSYEQAIWTYFMNYEACYKSAMSLDGHPGWYVGSMAAETWGCAMAYTMRAEGAWFQFLGCMSIPRL
jgi:hypothetical protein